MNEEVKKVEIYTSPSCHFCHAAKDFLNDNSISFEEYDIVANPEKKEELVEKSGQLGVPLIIVDGEMLVGFDEEKLKTLLKI